MKIHILFYINKYYFVTPISINKSNASFQFEVYPNIYSWCATDVKHQLNYN